MSILSASLPEHIKDRFSVLDTFLSSEKKPYTDYLAQDLTSTTPDKMYFKMRVNTTSVNEYNAYKILMDGEPCEYILMPTEIIPLTDLDGVIYGSVILFPMVLQCIQIP